MKEKIQSILTALNQANSMPAGQSRDEFISARIAELAKVTPPSVNKFTRSGTTKNWQLIASCEEFRLTLTVLDDEEDFLISAILQ